MSDRSRDPADPADLAGLPDDDPRVRSLGPRARAERLAYRAFVAPGEAPEGARLAEAEARLGETLEREVGITLAEDPRRTPLAGGGPRREGRFPGALIAPRWRPLLAAAAVAIVAGGVWISGSLRSGDETRIRGERPFGTDGAPVAASPRPLPGGALRLEWTPSAEAESYAVVFLSPELDEIARVEGLREPRLDLRPESLPAGLASGSRVLWRVSAMRGADEVSRSGAALLTVP